MSFAAKLKPASGDAKGSRKAQYYLVAIFVFSGLSPLSAAQAEDIHHDPRFWVEAGVYLPNAETQIQLSLPDSDNGTSFSLEDDLGFDTSVESFDLTIGAKLDDNFFIEGSIFALNRSSFLTLAKVIEVEDVIYDVGVQINSDFSSDIFRLTAGYRIIANPKVDVSIAIGAHLTTFDFGIIGEASANGQNAITQQRGHDLLAPLPTIVGQVRYRPFAWLELRGRADYLDLSIDRYNGKLVNLEASATAAIARNVALGLAYRFTDYEVGIDAISYEGSIEYKFEGPRIFMRFTI